MPAQLDWFLEDGTTPAPGQLDWGFIGPGQTAAPKTLLYRNTGDAPATNAVLTVAAVGSVDLEDWITGEHEGQTFSRAAPLDMGTLAPGAEGTVTLNLGVPAVAPLSSRPLMAQPGIEYDLEV